MLEVEVFGSGFVLDALSYEEVRHLCLAAAASAGVTDGHVAIEFVGAQRISWLNAEHREQHGPTDVLSFPVDGVEKLAARTSSADTPATQTGEPAVMPPRELGDVVICPEHTVDLREAIVHGVLHLVGMDHETDDGQMLALQRELLARESG
jgi:probable rRNA maturation factor